LEAVTARLEDLIEHAGVGASQLSTSTSTIAGAVSPSPFSPPAPAKVQVIEDPASVTAYNEQILKGKVQPFVKLTEKFAAASVVEQVGIFALLCAQRLTAQVNLPCRPSL
jgi:adenylyl cyclase-associated protein